jgi:enamine deaminase RidA (YjgF/YER057c/UK114 family)
MKIEKYCAPGVDDPPGHSQGVRVTGGQTMLFLAGQVAYDTDGSVKHRGDFTSQARGAEVSALAHPDYLIEVEAVAVI